MITAAITTTKISRGFSAIEVVHDRDRCFGFIRRTDRRFKAWWSGDRFDDHPLGEFETKAAALKAIATATTEKAKPAGDEADGSQLWKGHAQLT